jgi:hypothetical protein
VWGAQVERGAFVTSYIPTTSAAATRAADSISAIGNLNSIWSGGGNYSCLADIKILSAASVAFWNPSIVDDSNSSGMLLSHVDDNKVSSFATAGTNLITTTSFPNGQLFSSGVKIGYAHSGAGRSLVGGGGTVVTDAFTLNMLSGNIKVGFQSFAYFRRITGWNTRLADATLQALTAP